MSTIPSIHLNADQIGIPDLIAFIEQTVSTGLAWDSFAVRRHIEAAHVAVTYLHEYFDCLGHRPSLFDIAGLDGDVVADRIAPDLDREGRAGIAHTLSLLIDHARKQLDEITLTAGEIVSGLPQGWNVSTHSDRSEQEPEPAAGTSFASPVHITINLTIDSTSGQAHPPSGDDPAAATR